MLEPFGFSRRSLLQRTGVGFGMLGLASMLAEKEAAYAGASIAPNFAPKAKRVIHFFLNGGPSHVDTFDPKPSLLKYAGQSIPNTLLT